MSAPTTFLAALANETATAHLMADLALLIGPGDVITLSGDLGAGKTAAARAMIRYLADDATLEVPSPTFTLAQSYDLPALTLIHADLYRVSDERELEEIGLSPLPEGAIALIEWPERAGGALPPDRIDIAFNHRPALGLTARSAEITGHGKAAAQVERLKALREFLDGAGFSEAKRLRMPGDASTRSYARLAANDVTLILMNSPKRPDGPAIYDGKSYSAAVHLAEDVKPWVAIANGLRARGLSAPVIHHADRLELPELVAERRRLLEEVRGGKLRSSDLSGGTFTLSNLGMYGVDLFTAILTDGQAGILAVGRVADRVVAHEGKPAVRPTMLVSLSCDHRLVDGARAAEFLQTLAAILES